MNIVKLQNQLKSIPVETLIQYVQGTNPEVPSYLALAEIKNRKDMEAKYASQNQKAPEKSVAEDLTQAPNQSGIAMLAGNPMGNPAPQSAPTNEGVAGLPIPDQMFSGQGMASGGIVAFDDGGDVNYADGGMVAFGPGGDVASKKYQAWQEDSYLSPGSLYAGAKDLLGMPFQYAWTTDPVTGKLVRRKDVEGMTPSLDAYRKAAELRKQGLLAEADTLEKAAASPQVNRKGLASIDTSTAEPGMTFSPNEIANIYQSTLPPTKTRPVVDPNAPVAVAESPNVDVTKPMPGPAKSGIDSLLEKTEGVAETEMDRYDRMMGTNPERAKLEALTKKYETGAGEQERMAPWMALAKAGFTMAGGKSPFAIQNLSEGAVAGLADYAQAKDRLDKLNEKQIDIRSKLLQVDEARKSAAATYGLNSEAAIKARNAQKQLKQYEEENANLRNAASNATQLKAAQIAAAKKSDYETYLDAAKQDEDNYKMVKDKDGNVKKVFDATKVTQAFKSWSGTSSAATDKELIDKWSEKSFDKKFIAQYPTPADFVMAYRQKMSGATGAPGSSPAANRPPLGNIFNTK
jgi:hypothetical protein